MYASSTYLDVSVVLSLPISPATLFLAVYIFLISSYIFLRSSARKFFLPDFAAPFKSTMEGGMLTPPSRDVQFSPFLSHFSSLWSTFDYQTFFFSHFARAPKNCRKKKHFCADSNPFLTTLPSQFTSNLSFLLVAFSYALKAAHFQCWFLRRKMEQKSPTASIPNH